MTYSWGNVHLLLTRKWKNFPLDLNDSLVKNCAETTTWCNTATSGSGQLNSEHEVLDHYAEMDWLMVLSLITFELNVWSRLNWRFDYVWIEGAKSTVTLFQLCSQLISQNQPGKWLVKWTIWSNVWLHYHPVVIINNGLHGGIQVMALSIVEPRSNKQC